MVKYPVNSCTDVTGFSLLGHSFEMAQGSGITIHLMADKIPYHPEAYELAEMGFIPAGAYRNREYASAGVTVKNGITRAQQDIFYDPQTSGGLLLAVPEAYAESCLDELKTQIPGAAVVGYVKPLEESYIVLE